MGRSIVAGLVGLLLSQVTALPAPPSTANKNPAAGSCAAVAARGDSFTETTTGDVYMVMPSYDYYNSDLTAVQSSTYAGCFSACSNYYPCVAFVYAGDDNGGNCYLKAKAQGGSASTGNCAAIRISDGTGPRMYTNNPTTTSVSPPAVATPSASSTVAAVAGSCAANAAQSNYYISTAGQNYTLECGHDHNGGDLQGVPTDSFIACTDTCDNTPGCIAYSYTNNGGSQTCYLKKDITNDGTNSGVDYAYKSKATTSTSTAPPPYVPTSTSSSGSWVTVTSTRTGSSSSMVTVTITSSISSSSSSSSSTSSTSTSSSSIYSKPTSTSTSSSWTYTKPTTLSSSSSSWTYTKPTTTSTSSSYSWTWKPSSSSSSSTSTSSWTYTKPTTTSTGSFYSASTSTSCKPSISVSVVSGTTVTATVTASPGVWDSKTHGHHWPRPTGKPDGPLEWLHPKKPHRPEYGPLDTNLIRPGAPPSPYGPAYKPVSGVAYDKPPAVSGVIYDTPGRPSPVLPSEPFATISNVISAKGKEVFTPGAPGAPGAPLPAAAGNVISSVIGKRDEAPKDSLPKGMAALLWTPADSSVGSDPILAGRPSRFNARSTLDILVNETVEDVAPAFGDRNFLLPQLTEEQKMVLDYIRGAPEEIAQLDFDLIQSSLRAYRDAHPGEVGDVTRKEHTSREERLRLKFERLNKAQEDQFPGAVLTPEYLKIIADALKVPVEEAEATFDKLVRAKLHEAERESLEVLDIQKRAVHDVYTKNPEVFNHIAGEVYKAKRAYGSFHEADAYEEQQELLTARAMVYVVREDRHYRQQNDIDFSKPDHKYANKAGDRFETEEESLKAAAEGLKKWNDERIVALGKPH